MAKPRLKPSGKWEIGLRHPSLPNGRKYFTFDTEAEAIAYGQQWKLMKHADIPPPAELTAPTSPGARHLRLCRLQPVRIPGSHRGETPGLRSLLLEIRRLDLR